MVAAGTAKIEKSARQYRADFPILGQMMNGRKLAFLDTAASAQKPKIVIDSMSSVYSTGYANIHRGVYRISQELTTAFEEVRQKVADFIGAPGARNIVFTRNSTEAINLVAQSWGRTHLQKGDEVILSAMEHHANIVPWQLLQAQIGIEIKVIPVLDDGTLDYEAYQSLLSPRTKMVGVVHISNAFGVRNNISKIIKLSRDFNPKIKVLIDGSQGVVHSPVNVIALDADFYVFTGHKLYGPTGIGALYGKYEALESMPPYQGGGDMIERVSFSGSTFREPPHRFEAGTPPIAEVIGLGAAIDYVREIGFDFIQKREENLLAYGNKKLKEISGLKVFGDVSDKAGIFSFTIENMHPSDIGMVLDQCGVAVRAGHHCCMPLLERFGLDATVRASLGLYSNEEDIDALVEGLHKARELFQ
ncbi:MAG: cysteine desulfurase [Alphaproteobacteria bacterium]|nr:cysteine desulfurase [Alphaproteobacteria bacterium]